MRGAAAHLFEPRPAYRFRSVARPNLAPVGTSRGQNPAYGATINYWLKEAAPEPAAAKADKDGAASKGPIEITISDADGRDDPHAFAARTSRA